MSEAAQCSSIEFEVKDAFRESGEMQVAKVMAEILNKHYPPPAGIPFWWAVNVNVKGGVAYVYNLALSGRMGYLLHLDNLMAITGEKEIMRAGGEILERYGLPRNVRLINNDRLAALKRDFAGNLTAFTD